LYSSSVIVVLALKAVISSGFKKNVGLRKYLTSSSLAKLKLLHKAAYLLVSVGAAIAAKLRQVRAFFSI
jgi:hypothetical protein